MANLQVRIADDDKEDVEKILESMGLDMTTAVRMYFKQIQIERCIPFKVKSNLTVNGFTPEFEAEILRAAKEEEGSVAFDSMEDFLQDLHASTDEICE